MDPKKQELNPELKEIYNRVMNTQVKTPALPQTPTSPENSPTAPTPPQLAPAPTAVSAPPSAALGQSAPFVFTGNKVTTPQEPAGSGTQIHTASVKRISGPVIAALVVILIVVWGLFWAKFFGLF